MGWETVGHFSGVMVDVEEDLPSTCVLRSIFGKSENARNAQGKKYHGTHYLDHLL